VTGQWLVNGINANFFTSPNKSNNKVINHVINMKFYIYEPFRRARLV